MQLVHRTTYGSEAGEPWIWEPFENGDAGISEREGTLELLFSSALSLSTSARGLVGNFETSNGGTPSDTGKATFSCS